MRYTKESNVTYIVIITLYSREYSSKLHPHSMLEVLLWKLSCNLWMKSIIYQESNFSSTGIQHVDGHECAITLWLLKGSNDYFLDTNHAIRFSAMKYSASSRPAIYLSCIMFKILYIDVRNMNYNWKFHCTRLIWIKEWTSNIGIEPAHHMLKQLHEHFKKL